MARTVNGVSTILDSSRVICRMVGRFGASAFTAATTPEFGAAVAALVVACQAFEALDDYPGQRDNSGPIRSGEDGPPIVFPPS